MTKVAMSEKPLGRLPGDLTEEQMIRRMIRVDHAGEYGAVRIYEGQMSILLDCLIWSMVSVSRSFRSFS